MKKVICLLFLLLISVVVFPFKSDAVQMTSVQTMKRVAQQVAAYKAINGKSYSLENASSAIICGNINENLTLNEDVEYHSLKNYERSNVYVFHVEWNKLFFKDSYIVISGGGGYCSVYHERMNDVLRKNIDKWQALEDMPDNEYKALQEEQRKVAEKMWEDLKKGIDQWTGKSRNQSVN